MGLKLYQVDAFASDLFSGNPAGVCIVDDALFSNGALLQKIAAEMNLSETVFAAGRGGCAYALRWFTPAMEVPICGHATLSAAHILYETGAVPAEAQIVFTGQSGELRAKRRDDRIELDFPMFRVHQANPPKEAMRALGVRAVSFSQGREWAVVEVGTEEELLSLSPDFGALKNLEPSDWIVTCASADPAFDFCSRMFAPAVGIDEDPVTGAAHCVLAPYWADRLGKTEFCARQLSSRGGIVECVTSGDRVVLRGRALTVFDIEMRISL